MQVKAAQVMSSRQCAASLFRASASWCKGACEGRHYVCAGRCALGDMDGLDHPPLVHHRRRAVQAGRLNPRACAWMRPHPCLPRCTDGCCHGAACCAAIRARKAWIYVTRVSRNCRATSVAANVAHCRCRYRPRYAAVANARHHHGMQRGRLSVMRGRWIGWRRVSNSVAILPPVARSPGCGRKKFHWRCRN